MASPDDVQEVSTPSVDSDSDALDDMDSTLENLRSTASSLASSTNDHVEEHGRAYRKDGKYYFPNDVREIERLNLQHVLFRQTLNNNLSLAPIGKNPQRVLDIGTGTGIWATEFANLHPSAEVIGTDLSPNPPEFVPPNCKFETGDVEAEWNFNQPFDYIHGRALATCLTDPGSVIKRAFAALVPGGYLEMQDAIMPMKYVGTVPVDSYLYKYNENVVAAATMAKRPWTNVKNNPDYFRDAGFEDIQVKKFYWPTNAWPKGEYFKNLGVIFNQDAMEGLEGITMKLFTHFLGWTSDDVQSFLVGVRKDFKDKHIHAYVEISVVCGRKPMIGGFLNK